MQAGPGTGKTETLGARVAQQLLSGLAPDEIVVVSFTNQASPFLLTLPWPLPASSSTWPPIHILPEPHHPILSWSPHLILLRGLPSQAAKEVRARLRRWCGTSLLGNVVTIHCLALRVLRLLPEADAEGRAEAPLRLMSEDDSLGLMRTAMRPLHDPKAVELTKWAELLLRLAAQPTQQPLGTPGQSVPRALLAPWALMRKLGEVE